MSCHHLPGFCATDPSAIAEQQVLPEFYFEEPYLSTQSGLRDRQRSRSLRKAGVLHDGEEVCKFLNP